MLSGKMIGELLRENRKQNNMTQMNVADKLGIDFQVISNYENGRRMPSIEWVMKYCDAIEADFGKVMTELNERRLK